MNIGEEINYKDSRGKDVDGTITEMKKGDTLTNIKTGDTDTDTVRLKIKPNDGSKSFWTSSMHKVKDEE